MVTNDQLKQLPENTHILFMRGGTIPVFGILIKPTIGSEYFWFREEKSIYTIFMCNYDLYTALSEEEYMLNKLKLL